MGGKQAIFAGAVSLINPGDDVLLENPCWVSFPQIVNFAEGRNVMPALMRKFHDSLASDDPEVVVWGTGSPLREFLHVDDLADACVHLMEHYDGEEHVNVGTGEDLTIRQLAETIRDVVHPGASIRFDPSRPDGMPRKQLDVSKLHALGWHHRIALVDGIRSTYEWYQANHAPVASTA